MEKSFSFRREIEEQMMIVSFVSRSVTQSNSNQKESYLYISWFVILTKVYVVTYTLHSVHSWLHLSYDGFIASQCKWNFVENLNFKNDSS